MDANQLHVYGADGLFVRLDSLRGRLAVETDGAVRAFIVLQVDDVIAEMKRRVDSRVLAIATSKLS